MIIKIKTERRTASQSRPRCCCERIGARVVRRRAFVSGALALLAAPLASEAQQQKVPRIGYVGYATPGSDPAGIAGLRDGLRELGFVENQNILIEYRFAEGKLDRLPDLIRQLISLKVDVLLAQGTSVTAAAKRATTTIPIVSVSGDPLGSGFVQSLAWPGGNITGLSFGQSENFGGKWLELVRAAIPKASLVGIILNPANRSGTEALKEMETLAPSLGLRLIPQTVQRPADLEAAFGALTRARVAAVIIMTDPLVVGQTPHIVKAAADRAGHAMTSATRLSQPVGWSSRRSETVSFDSTWCTGGPNPGGRHSHSPVPRQYDADPLRLPALHHRLRGRLTSPSWRNAAREY